MRTQYKDFYRRLEGLLEASATPVGGGSDVPPEPHDVDARVERFLGGFVAEMGPELRVAAARFAVEHRSRFVGRSEEAPALPIGSVLERLGVDLLGVYGEKEAGEEFGETAPVAAVVFGEAPDRRLVLLSLEEGAPRGAEEQDALSMTLSVLRSVLSVQLVAARLGDTLREAALIQQSLLPAQPPRFPGYSLAARSVAAHDVGGDLFDFLPLKDGLLAITVGDASGHGLPAALLARDVVVGLRMGLEADLKSDSVLARLNSVVHASALSSCFVSLFLAELEDNGSLFYFNAGHEPPLLFDAAGEVVELARGELVLGPLPDTRFKRRFAHVDRGATLVLFSDGLLERRGGGGELFGRARLEAAVRGSQAQGPQAVVESVFTTAERFGGADRWEDDATLVVVQREP